MKVSTTGVMYRRPTAHSSCCSARTAPTRRRTAGRLGKMPTTSVRRRISLLRRSCGLLDQIFFQWAVRLGQRGKRSAAHSLGHDTSDKRLRYGIRGLHQINGGKTSYGTARSATVCGCRFATMGPVSLMTTQRAARGFRNMREEAERMGGRLVVETSGSEWSTAVTCVLPYERTRGGS